MRQLAGKYDDIIIDVGGRDTGNLRAALTVSQMLLVPMQPRSFDIWAIDQVTEAREINDALRAFMMLNSADAQGQDNEDAAEALKEVATLQWLDAPVGRRKAFPNAAAAGRSVIEHTPKDPKAIDELCRLADLLYSDRHTDTRTR